MPMPIAAADPPVSVFPVQLMPFSFISTFDIPYFYILKLVQGIEFTLSSPEIIISGRNNHDAELVDSSDGHREMIVMKRMQ